MTLHAPPSAEAPVSDLYAWARPLAALAAAGGLIGAFAVVRPDLMMVEQVAFVGAHHASVESLRHLSDIRNGDPLWSVDLDRVERGVRAHPWVRAARAARKWPATVEVEVVEYEPVALVRWDGLRYVDADGTLFLGAHSDDLDYPVITGIDGSLAEAHPNLPAMALRDTLNVLTSLDERGIVARSDVSEVAFSTSHGFTVQLRSGSRVLFGLDGLERQLDRLATLVSREGLDLSSAVHVDLAPMRVAIVRPLARPGGEG